jgi:protein maelstrom
MVVRKSLTTRLTVLENSQNQLTMSTENDTAARILLESSTSTITTTKQSSLKFSAIGIFMCFATFVLAILFKDYFINLLVYFEDISKNYFLVNFILCILFILVSLPIVWGYTLCMLICSYIYSFLFGLLLVIVYSGVGMTISFYICRSVSNKLQCSRFNSYNLQARYLNVLVTIIEGPHRVKIVLLSRLVPLPFGLTNSIFSVTNVRFFDYIFASIIGLIPTQILTCYVGSTFKSMKDALNSNTAHEAYFILAVQIVVAVVLMVFMLKLAKIEFNKQLNALSANNLQTNFTQVQLSSPLPK